MTRTDHFLSWSVILDVRFLGWAEQILGLVGDNTALWVAGASADGEMVSSFQHMQLVCTIRVGPT